MTAKALFAGLVFDEYDRPLDVAYVGDEPCYVINDAGFLRHVPAADIDRHVLAGMVEQVRDNEDLFADQTAKMLGQDDIFTRAIIQNQLKHIDQQVEALFQTGIPEEGRAYMGMMGFRVVVNIHGEVIRVDQPGSISDDGE